MFAAAVAVVVVLGHAEQRVDYSTGHFVALPILR